MIPAIGNEISRRIEPKKSEAHKNAVMTQRAPTVQRDGYKAPAPTPVVLSGAPRGKLPGDRNGDLGSRNENQFIPDDVLAYHDPQRVRDFIKTSNDEAYAPEIAAAQSKVDSLQRQLEVVSDNPRHLHQIEVLSDQLDAAQKDLDQLTSTRDAQTAAAVKDFDDTYNKTLGSATDPTSQRIAFDAAASHYQDYVFYHSTDPQTVKGPLFVKGAGDTTAISENDVNQRGIGDCWFLSTMADMAKENPAALQNMIKDNGDGTYTVTFHKQVAVPGVGMVDAPFPVTVDGKVPEGWSHVGPGDKGETWPIIMEKAFAQLKGSYGALDGGWPADAYYSLTGKQMDRKTGSEIPSASTLADYDAQGRVMIFDTAGSDPAQLAKYGLYGGHAYAVQNMFTGPDGKEYVQLYNPWGTAHGKPVPLDEIANVFAGVSYGPPAPPPPRRGGPQPV